MKEYRSRMKPSMSPPRNILISWKMAAVLLSASTSTRSPPALATTAPSKVRCLMVPTFLPAIIGLGGWFSSCIWFAKVAVNAEKDMIPVMIHITEKTRAPNVFGTRSPYPTVVMVTKLHQKPSNQPMRNDLGNMSLVHVSLIQQTKPAMTANMMQMAIT